MNAGSFSAVASMNSTAPHGTTIQCHENDVPPFVDSVLPRLYGNLFSSLAYWRIHGGAEQASTYVVYDGDTIVTLLLYRRKGSTVHVVNEGFLATEAEVNRFARYVFSTYANVTVILFHAVHAQVKQLSYPFQRYNCLEDMVLSLPASVADYKAHLGKSTRSYLNRYLNKARRELPTFEFCAFDADEIEADDLQRIIELNRQRMAYKGKVSINDDATAQNIIQLAMECGFTGLVRIDGKVCAGTINYRVGDNYFLEVIAHDPAYNDYRLGTLCAFLTVCACIERGGAEYHFLWGQDEYKTRLRAVQRDLDDIVIYRSRRRMLTNSYTALKQICSFGVRNLRLWIRATRRKRSLLGSVVTHDTTR